MKKGLYKILSIMVAVAVLATTLPFGALVSAANESNEITLVDNSTHHHWHEDIENSTKEIGRIWTDKTVWDSDVVYPYEHQMPGQLGVAKGDSDLLVELSAISSAASVTGKVTTSVPLDIVLVMDTSGSMADPIPSGEYVLSERAQSSIWYSELYSQNNTSYFKIGEEYVPITVTRSTGNNRRYTVSYMKPGETNPTYIANNVTNRTFSLPYDLYTEGTITQLAALKSAVNKFIDQTKAANDLIEEQSNKHRISLVRFADNSQRLIGLTYVDTTTNVQTLKNSVSGLNASGATRADYGMDTAESTLIGNNNSARDDAQKVVIFFTDGTPTTYNSFSDTVANSAVSSAKALKDNDTIIYTIGVYEEADPNDTSENFNQYMHAMSSNYPSATTYTNRGTRADNSNYYLAATDASSLNSVFTGILEDVTSLKANASTQVEEGNEGASGYITFVDPLGKYMQVDAFKAISFAERNYTNPTVAINNNITTYTFEGANSNNPLYPTTGNLNQIIITVEKSNSLSVGDIVTVKIPGALIPIHYYDVDIDENGNITMTEDTTLPMRIWYGVSLKNGVKSALENPDAELSAYIDANKDADGNVMFYSNLYNKDEASVYSTFEPNQRNNFYFFQNDEYLFTDAACTQPATTSELNESTIYYYQRDYYHPVSNPSYTGEAEKLVNTVTIPGSSNTLLAGYAKRAQNGQWYIPKGVPRTTSITEYSVTKTDVFAGATNKTGTSGNVIYPSWINVTENPTTVKNELGNNGIVKLSVPGALAITKLVTADSGLTAPDKDFTFKITLTAAQGETLKDSYNAQIFNADGTAVGDAFEYKPATADTIVLKANQTAYIYGLDAGTVFSISEINIPDGFTKERPGNDEGQISSGQTTAVRVTNNYSVDSISFTGTELGLIGTKILVDREFRDTDSFEFMVAPTVYSPDAPLPDKAASGRVTVSADGGYEKTFDIGTFTFTKPGEYHYEIREIIPSTDKIPGISYDSTIYRVVIKIADNGEGKLVLGNLEIDKNDSATGGWESLHNQNTLPNANHLKFTNVYSVDTENIVIRGTKTLNGKNLVDYTSAPFEFEITAAGSKEIGSSDDFAYDSEQPMPSATTVVATSTGDIIFPNIALKGVDIGKVYKYIITEKVPVGAQGGVYNGITYDTSEKEVIVEVNKSVVGAEEVIAPIVSGNQFNFTNSYESKPTSYEILGKKNLIGRNFKQGDTFKFEITPVDGAPAPAQTSVTINPTQGNQKDFSLGTVSFDHEDLFDGDIVSGSSARVKTFTYKLREVALGAGGIAYDTAERILTLEVKDLNGQTEITSVKLNGTEIAKQDKIVWTNEYKASVAYGGINVMKTLLGKALLKNEFSFEITAEGATPNVSAGDMSFSVPFDSYYNPAGDYSAVVMPKLIDVVFDQDDAGKTFSYVIEEVIPQEAGRTTYDKSTYRIELKPYDNGDGTMGVKTVITQLTTQNGLVDGVNSEEYDSIDPGIPSVHFINRYSPAEGVLDGETNLAVVKSLIGREWNEDDEFTFELSLVDEDDIISDEAVIMPNETTIAITKDTADYSKAFGDIRFTEVGTYTFNIKELAPTGGKKDAVTYDTNISKIVVDVTNKGTGTLDVNVISADTLTFVNIYKIETGTSVNISGKKTLTNKELVDGMFNFEFYLADENFAVDGEPIDITTNQNGEFQFRIDYEPIDAGNTFYYVLKEENAGQIIEGIHYDDTEYHITVTVGDDGIGGATAVKTIKKGESTVDTVEFKNEYRTTAGKATISGNKELDGRELKDNEFSFKIFAADSSYAYDKDNALQTVKNTADGKFQFNELTFNAPGTYYFVVAEDSSVAIEGITFDESVYYVMIEVKDDGKGTLVVEASVITKKDSVERIEKIAFRNVYVPVLVPPTPQPPVVPQTGDNSNLWLWFALFLVSGLGIIAISYKSKKESENENK